MRRPLIPLLALMFIALPLPITHAANPSPGAACTKVGLIQIYKTKKFTCVRTKGKLSWNKGVPTSKQESGNKPSPSPTPSPTDKVELAADGYPSGVPAPGRTCPSETTTAKLGDLFLICEQGIWKINQGIFPNPTSKPSSVPSPITIPDPKADPATVPSPGRFCLNEESRFAFKNEVLICSRGVWGRQLGIRMTPTPLPTASISKQSLISEREIETRLLANWAEWRKRKLSNSPKMTIVLQDGYSQDWEVVTRDTINYTNNVLDGNGLKIVQTPYWVFGETEDFRVKIFNEFAKTAPCNPPYIANSEEAIYCATFDIGSGGLRIGKPGVSMTNNYRLSTRDKKLLTYFVAHDMGIFYVVQTQYKDIPYTGNKNQIPAWIREGTAQIIGLLVTNDLFNSSKSYLDVKPNDQWVGTKPESICSRDIQDAEGREKIMPDSCSQSQHLYAVSLLAAKYGGLEALFKFHRLYGENDDWVKSFKESFGITREDFYREWWAYLGIDQKDWPDIQPPTPPERY